MSDNRISNYIRVSNLTRLITAADILDQVQANRDGIDGAALGTMRRQLRTWVVALEGVIGRESEAAK